MAPWSRATTKGASLALLATLGCLSLLAADTSDPRTGVPIRYEIDASTFPASWRGGEVNARATRIPRSEDARSQRLAMAALGRYPREVVTKHLRAVHFVGEMSFYGVPYGGTNSRDAVYIANRGADAGFDDAFIVSTFHHEFSSILLRNNPDRFDELAWTGANAPHARYGTGGTQAIKDGTANTAYRAELHSAGFLNQYSTSSVEEDFNTFAEALFRGDARLWNICRQFPRVARKKDLIVAFYASLDPSLTEEFFRSLAE
ncbi:MAG: hypothetical protein WD716_08475 [Fimbriimonadaceae bacterium]